MVLFCINSQLVKAVGCFCRGAPLMMLGNSDLGESFHHWGYARKSLTNSLDLHQHKYNKGNSSVG